MKEPRLDGIPFSQCSTHDLKEIVAGRVVPIELDVDWALTLYTSQYWAAILLQGREG